jgi:hypothetical protein
MTLVAGISKHLIEERASHLKSQIETHAPDKVKYSLIAKVVNVGVALLVFAKDEGVARCISDVHTTWTGCGPLYLGNKGAVGVRFRVSSDSNNVGELYT